MTHILSKTTLLDLAGLRLPAPGGMTSSQAARWIENHRSLVQAKVLGHLYYRTDVISPAAISLQSLLKDVLPTVHHRDRKTSIVEEAMRKHVMTPISYLGAITEFKTAVPSINAPIWIYTASTRKAVALAASRQGFAGSRDPHIVELLPDSRKAPRLADFDDRLVETAEDTYLVMEAYPAEFQKRVIKALSQMPNCVARAGAIRAAIGLPTHSTGVWKRVSDLFRRRIMGDLVQDGQVTLQSLARASVYRLSNRDQAASPQQPEDLIEKDGESSEAPAVPEVSSLKPSAPRSRKQTKSTPRNLHLGVIA